MAEVDIYENILKRNNDAALRNKRIIGRAFSINMMSSPGAGKTTILEKTADSLKGRYRVAVIEGDITTSNDTRRIKKKGVEAIQIKTENYGGGCHLDARMVAGALKKLKFSRLYDLIIIENVGNLICPADFDLGEDKKVVVLSVTEGEDKPLKYPLMFERADLMILNKVDLLPYTDFDTGELMRNVKRINKRLRVIEMSAKNGTGIDAWLSWLMDGIKAKRSTNG